MIATDFTCKIRLNISDIISTVVKTPNTVKIRVSLSWIVDCIPEKRLFVRL